MMTKEIKWAVEQRLKFIEIFLGKKGRINREDITKKFRVSEKTAQNDLAAYRERNPKSIKYSAKTKCYRAIGEDTNE